MKNSYPIFLNKFFLKLYYVYYIIYTKAKGDEE